MKRALVAVAATTLVVNGCSWLAIETAPRRPPPERAVRCDESHRAQAVDEVGYATMAIVTPVIALLTVASENLDAERGTVIGVMAALTLLYGASAAYGHHHLRRCRSFQAAPRDSDLRP